MSWREEVYKRLRSLPNAFLADGQFIDFMPLKEALQILTERLWMLEQKINELEKISLRTSYPKASAASRPP